LELQLSFQVYRTLTRQLVKTMGTRLKGRADKALKEFDKAFAASGFLDMAVDAERDQGDTLLKQICQEGAWIRDGRPTYFIESIDLAERLIRAQVSMERLVAPENPVTFAVAIPQGWQHKGVKMESVLVTISTPRAALEMRQDDLLHRWGTQYRIGLGEGLADAGVAVSMSFLAIDQVDPDGNPLPKGSPQVYLNTTLSPQKLTELLSARTFDDQRALTTMAGGQVGLYALNDAELALQGALSRLVGNLWVYLQAVEGALQPGLPGKVQDGETPSFGPGRYFSLKDRLSAPAQERGVEEHYRSWHFRQLMDQRYYRGEHAGKPQGSRWVFVNEAIVGGAVEPSTVVEAPGIETLGFDKS
jgi:hypothetical protein